MFRGGSIRLLTIAGIRIGVDFSWFLVLFLFIFLLSDYFREALASGSESQAYLIAVLSALLFFVSLVLHELGHALVARRLGIGISGIDLWFFGGIAKMTRDTERPGQEFAVAAAGPAVTLLIAIACFAASAAITGPEQFLDVATFNETVATTPALLLINWLGTINLFLLVFNLVPAFPLDGGRIARAIAWKITGSRVKATRIAGALGQVFAYILIGLGIFQLLMGSVINGLWLAVLGWFLLTAARGATAQSAVTERLEGIRVADVMDPSPVAIPADLPVARAEEEYFMRYRWPWFPVTDELGRFVGLVEERRISAALAAGADAKTQTIRDLMQRDDDGLLHVAADDPLESVLGLEPLRRLGAIMAVDGHGMLRGVVTIEQVRRALATQPVVRPQ